MNYIKTWLTATTMHWQKCSKKKQNGNVLRSSWDGPLAHRLQATARPVNSALPDSAQRCLHLWKDEVNRGGKKKACRHMPMVSDTRNQNPVSQFHKNCCHRAPYKGKKKLPMYRTWIESFVQKLVAFLRHSAKCSTNCSSQNSYRSPPCLTRLQWLFRPYNTNSTLKEQNMLCKIHCYKSTQSR